ncbi:hypothetical protein [Pseudonocardia nigra]|uniref:hypothetical protein n=1 Tax=Pseudonocardia nigra TaxID=1921578 RepID=UPI001C5F4812|nr:hypothetical protein [Pseudonocardia nigra]
MASPPSAVAWASPSWCWPVWLALPWVLLESTELSCSISWSPSEPNPPELRASLFCETGAWLVFDWDVELSCV